MANHTVVIPRNPKNRLELAGRVFAKHQTDGAGSPLSTLQENTWTDNGPRAIQALSLHNQAEALVAQAEALYRQRDVLLAPVDQTLRSSRDLLLGIHRSNPKRLGDWGFEVNDARRGPSGGGGGGNG